MTALGLLGTLCFILCGIPQAIKAVEDGHARGVSGLFLALWFFGSLVMLVYVRAEHPEDRFLLANYIVNLAVSGVICRYKLFPRRP